MIRENALFCKLIRIKKSGRQIFESSIATVKLSEEVCPFCGSQGYCDRYGEYTRNLVDYENDEVRVTALSVPRVICRSCSTQEHKHTHAILPDCIVPYSSFSLIFILSVLFRYFCTTLTLREICDQFLISPVQVYRWISLLKQHMREWLGVLTAAETPPDDFVRAIMETTNYTFGFGCLFLHRTGRSFLQSHANPTNCRYPRF